jgi:pimeloyl-ACP methyl ester carboxylesterase
METSGFHSTADGTRLFWRTVGHGAQTVVVLHGGPGFHMNYLVEDLRRLAAERRLLFYDQRAPDNPTCRAMHAP